MRTKYRVGVVDRRGYFAGLVGAASTWPEVMRLVEVYAPREEGNLIVVSERTGASWGQQKVVSRFVVRKRRLFALVAKKGQGLGGLGNIWECSMCGGPVVELGPLGNRMHGQCRNCGMNQSYEMTRRKRARNVQKPPRRRGLAGLGHVPDRLAPILATATVIVYDHHRFLLWYGGTFVRVVDDDGNDLRHLEIPHRFGRHPTAIEARKRMLKYLKEGV